MSRPKTAEGIETSWIGAKEEKEEKEKKREARKPVKDRSEPSKPINSNSHLPIHPQSNPQQASSPS